MTNPATPGAGTGSTWFALLANIALPAYAAFKYAQFALAPQDFSEEYAQALVTLLIAQIPLVILGAVFAGVSYIEGPAWRRVLIYAIVVAIIAVIGGFAKLAFDTEMGPIIAWALAMQILLLVFVGPQKDLAHARIEAVTGDAANLTVIMPFAGLIAIVAAVAGQPYGSRFFEWRSVELEWSDSAWIGAAYFALRAWSAAYVYTPWFERRRKGYFERPWIDWLFKKRSSPGDG